MLCLVLFSAVLFYSCGNPLLNLDGTDGQPPGETTPDISSDTTEEDVPKNVTPIYIDTQAQFNEFCKMGAYGVQYKNDGYYILRGKDVKNRTFYTSTVINDSFTGVLTGWYKDDTHKTTTKIISIVNNSLFSKPMENAKVSWLKFEFQSAAAINNPENPIGIVAGETKNTRFEYVWVAGTVSITAGNPLNPIYAGGFVGKANTGTVFENCTAGASVSVTFETSANDGYVGGFAGELLGSVKNSTVSIISPESLYPSLQPINVTAKINNGSGRAYAGGVAGLFKGGTIESTVVRTVVSATGKTGNAFGGGFAGQVDGGIIKDNTTNGSLTVTAESGVTEGSTVFAGGIAGESNTELSNNILSGTVRVVSKYYNGTSYSGGLVGKLTANGKITGSSINGNATVQSYSHDVPANPSGLAYAGGLAGYSEGVIEESSFWSSYGGVSAGSISATSPPTVAASQAYAGGIAGYATGNISKVYAYTPDSSSTIDSHAGIDARVDMTHGVAAAGGLIGKTGGTATISESYAVLTVKARAKDVSGSGTPPYGAIAGGIVGIGSGPISNTFALAQVDARVETNSSHVPVYAGGIAGYLDNTTVKTSYAAGSVLAHTFQNGGTVCVGGIVGYAHADTAMDSVEKCVALQRFIGSDGTMYRVIGAKATYSSLAGNYAYVEMRKYNAGSVINDSTNNSVNATGGADITATDAKTLNYYTATLGWGDIGVWKESTNYPILQNMSAPQVPSWAVIP
jgi:hypothetical protein